MVSPPFGWSCTWGSSDSCVPCCTSASRPGRQGRGRIRSTRPLPAMAGHWIHSASHRAYIACCLIHHHRLGVLSATFLVSDSLHIPDCAVSHGVGSALSDRCARGNCNRRPGRRDLPLSLKPLL